VSPTDDSNAWKLLSGTVLSSLGTTPRTDIEVKRVAVAPGIMVANSGAPFTLDKLRSKG
jgi:Gly-Xaa carboxypeptidase